MKLSVSERREAAKELEAEGMSQREIGAVLGVDKQTVNNDLKTVENSTDTETKRNKNKSPTDDAVENSTPVSEPLDTLTGLAADDELRKEAERREAKTRAAEENWRDL